MPQLASLTEHGGENALLLPTQPSSLHPAALRPARCRPEKAGLIWHQTVRDPRIVEGTRFAEFAAVTIDVASRLPNMKSADVKAVANAWAEVGVAVTS